MDRLLLLFPLGYLLAISIPLAVIDLREHRLPNKLTISAIAVTLFCLVASTWLSRDWLALFSALVAAAATFLIGWLLAARSLVGMGDIKLLVSLNAFAGYLAQLLPLLSLAVAMILATVVSSVSLFRKRLTMQSSIALGPYLLLGFYLAVIPRAVEITAVAWS